MSSDSLTAGGGGASRPARFAYVGTFTRGAPGGAGQERAAGISVFAVDAGSGALSLVQVVPAESPAFLALDPGERFLYAVNEIDDYNGGRHGSVEAYAIDPATGELHLLNREDAGGTGPTHLAVDPSGRFVAVASYSGQNFTLLPIAADGRLLPVSDTITNSGTGPNQARQEAPHPHGVVFDPVGGYLVTADLGIDRIQVFRLNSATAKLEATGEFATAPGAGPRHLAFSADARVLYVINELDATIGVYDFDATRGRVRGEIQTISTVPDDFVGTKSTAEVAVHPSGRFVYGSNRRQPDATSPVADSIVAYTVDPTGRLRLIGHTPDGIANPRHFGIDPTGAWLYACNQQSGTIVQFAIDQESGRLTPTGHVTTTPTPVCIVFKRA